MVTCFGPELAERSESQGLPLGEQQHSIGDLLRKRLRRASIESISRTDHETVISYNFQGITESALQGLQDDLGAAARNSRYDVFFNRPAAL